MANTNPYLTFQSDTAFTLSATKYWDGTVEYSTDLNTWTTWDGTSISSSSSSPYVLYLRGTGNTKMSSSSASSGVFKFSGASNLKAIGNINTLLEYSNPPTIIPSAHCYEYMFQNCTSLTTPPELPATSLAGVCYQGMFQGCSSLTTAPELPATSLAGACYRQMFQGCTSLQTPPELPATTLASACYEYMFQGCSSLTTAPELPATSLASSCYYYMFYGCTSLTTAPELPATSLASYCYQCMFQSCTSLTTPPELPATTLANNCYYYMFNGCSSLTTAPELSATSLASYCYQGMFQSCTSLTTPPELPATTLANNCYYYMFNGCTKLKVSQEKTSELTRAWRIPTSGVISTEPSGWNTSMLSGTGGTFTSNPSINTTYYVLPLEKEPKITYLIYDITLEKIANTIRSINGETDKYTPKEMASKISKLKNPTGSITITANGTYDVTQKASAIINIPVTPTQAKTFTISTNGTYAVTPDSGYALSKVTIVGAYATDATITASDVASGKIGYNGDTKITGTLEEYNGGVR